MAMSIGSWALPAAACSIVIPDDELDQHTTAAYFKKANDVVLARLERMSPGAKEGWRKASFSSLRRFKGQPMTDFDLDLGADIGCGPDFTEGGQYVLFLEAASNGTQRISMGTRGPMEPGSDSIESYLRELNALSKKR
ncbi:hypothetical protein M2650_05960 [Luteimonas sp. SX5]|uniref:DUF4019 domain-containing protein n=2 Tax=Luteimonas galliterrae TaxID=2940486 RepID=A0ABT0MH22_9GAMM|nr:hypothetical protein [Luteimonas galliterrae]